MSTAPDVTGALLAAAHNYRNRGWRVIQLHRVIQGNQVVCSCREEAACGSKGKHPIAKKWQETPVMSGADIEEAWTKPGRHRCNVGIATGVVSGIWVLDLDPKDGGIENFRTLLAEVGQGEFPATYCVQTGSGGFHYYFLMPEDDLRNSASRIAPGVDIRANGGQVVAAPSVSDVGPYTVLRDVDPAPAPEWLLNLVRKPTRDDIDVVTAADLPKPEDIDQAEWERLTSYAKKAIDSELSRLDKLSSTGWNGEPWNHTLFEVSCAVLEFANSPWNAYSVGQAQNDVFTRSPRDPLGFDDFVVQKTWNSARERVGDKARAIPQTRQKTVEIDLFASPDVRGVANPTEGGGAPTTPAVAGSTRSPARFFTGPQGAELDAVELTNGILEMGPVGWGRDEDFWSYQDGVWRSDRQVVKRRCTELLDYKYRPGHYATAKDTTRFKAVPLTGDPTPRWINFRNGMLDWQSGDLLEHDPGYKSTIQLPINYDPTQACPTFDAFLADILHPDYVRLAWEMLGYLMFSGNPQQIAFLFYGGGQNGKGTLIRVIEQILGRENIAHESLDQLNKSNFSTVNLYGKIANIAGDIDSTYQESTANFKKITGEDVLGAERKFGDRFEFENWAVPLFSANEIPGSSDVTEGYLRRWIILHFHKHITNPTRGLSELLSTEIEGIAAKAILPLQNLMRNGSFDLSGEAAKGREEFAETIDQVRQWIRHGGPRVAPDSQQPLSELYFEYTVWATKTNQGRLREQAFSRRLASIGYETVEAAGITYHKGIRCIAGDRSPSHGFF